MRIGLALATVATAFAVATAVPAATFYVTTGQTDGVFSIAAGESRSWNITPQATEAAFGGGIFMMKRGAGISAGITLALHEDTGYRLAFVGYPDSSFVGQDFVQINMLVPPFYVSANTSYQVRLTVDADTSSGGDNQYFFQGDPDALTLDTRLPEEIILTSVSTPEPASALLLAGGLLGLGIARRRQMRATPAAG